MHNFEYVSNAQLILHTICTSNLQRQCLRAWTEMHLCFYSGLLLLFDLLYLARITPILFILTQNSAAKSSLKVSKSTLSISKIGERSGSEIAALVVRRWWIAFLFPQTRFLLLSSWTLHWGVITDVCRFQAYCSFTSSFRSWRWLLCRDSWLWSWESIVSAWVCRGTWTFVVEEAILWFSCCCCEFVEGSWKSVVVVDVVVVVACSRAPWQFRNFSTISEIIDLVSTQLCSLSLSFLILFSLSFSLTLSLCILLRHLNVKEIQVLSLGAVHIEPPVTHELLLVEDGSVGTQEVKLYKYSVTIVWTNMIQLTISLWISIVSLTLIELFIIEMTISHLHWLNFTEERCIRCKWENWIIFTWYSWNMFYQLVKIRLLLSITQWYHHHHNDGEHGTWTSQF